MQTKTSRFAETVASLSKKAVAGTPAPAYRPGKEGYADWVILAVQVFKEYLGHDYRKLMDVLREMPRVAESLSLTVETLPHYSTVYARKQAIPMKRWRAILSASVDLYVAIGLGLEDVEYGPEQFPGLVYRMDDLLGFVNDAVREASNQETPYLLGIASPTGWIDRVQNLVKEDELARTRFSRHVSVCLVDLRNGELIYDPADPVVAENISLFKRAVQTEAVDECYAYIKSEYVSDLGRETVMLQEITNEPDYDRHVVKRSFDRVESNGDGEQFYIDEDGLAIDIS